MQKFNLIFENTEILNQLIECRDIFEAKEFLNHKGVSLTYDELEELKEEYLELNAPKGESLTMEELDKVAGGAPKAEVAHNKNNIGVKNSTPYSKKKKNIESFVAVQSQYTVKAVEQDKIRNERVEFREEQDNREQEALDSFAELFTEANHQQEQYKVDNSIHMDGNIERQHVVEQYTERFSDVHHQISTTGQQSTEHSQMSHLQAAQHQQERHVEKPGANQNLGLNFEHRDIMHNDEGQGHQQIKFDTPIKFDAPKAESIHIQTAKTADNIAVAANILATEHKGNEHIFLKGEQQSATGVIGEQHVQQFNVEQKGGEHWTNSPEKFRDEPANEDLVEEVVEQENTEQHMYDASIGEAETPGIQEQQGSMDKAVELGITPESDSNVRETQNYKMKDSLEARIERSKQNSDASKNQEKNISTKQIADILNDPERKGTVAIVLKERTALNKKGINYEKSIEIINELIEEGENTAAEILLQGIEKVGQAQLNLYTDVNYLLDHSIPKDMHMYIQLIVKDKLNNVPSDRNSRLQRIRQISHFVDIMQKIDIDTEEGRRELRNAFYGHDPLLPRGGGLRGVDEGDQVAVELHTFDANSTEKQKLEEEQIQKEQEILQSLESMDEVNRYLERKQEEQEELRKQEQAIRESLDEHKAQLQENEKCASDFENKVAILEKNEKKIEEEIEQINASIIKQNEQLAWFERTKKYNEKYEKQLNAMIESETSKYDIYILLSARENGISEDIKRRQERGEDVTTLVEEAKFVLGMRMDIQNKGLEFVVKWLKEGAEEEKGRLEVSLSENRKRLVILKLRLQNAKQSTEARKQEQAEANDAVYRNKTEIEKEREELEKISKQIDLNGSYIESAENIGKRFEEEQIQKEQEILQSLESMDEVNRYLERKQEEQEELRKQKQAISKSLDEHKAQLQENEERASDSENELTRLEREKKELKAQIKRQSRLNAEEKRELESRERFTKVNKKYLEQLIALIAEGKNIGEIVDLLSLKKRGIIVAIQQCKERGEDVRDLIEEKEYLNQILMYIQNRGLQLVVQYIKESIAHNEEKVRSLEASLEENEKKLSGLIEKLEKTKQNIEWYEWEQDKANEVVPRIKTEIEKETKRLNETSKQIDQNESYIESAEDIGKRIEEEQRRNREEIEKFNQYEDQLESEKEKQIANKNICEKVRDILKESFDELNDAAETCKKQVNEMDKKMSGFWGFFVKIFYIATGQYNDFLNKREKTINEGKENMRSILCKMKKNLYNISEQKEEDEVKQVIIVADDLISNLENVKQTGNTDEIDNAVIAIQYKRDDYVNKVWEAERAENQCNSFIEMAKQRRAEVENKQKGNSSLEPFNFSLNTGFEVEIFN